jgi:hypothetical protein
VNPIAAVTAAILGVLAALVVLAWVVLAVSVQAAVAALFSASNALRRTG